jgi:hypothetical protein
MWKKNYTEKSKEIIQRLYDYPPSDFSPVVHLEYPWFGQLCLALIACSPINSHYFIFHISIDIPTGAANIQLLRSQPTDGIWQCHYF